MAHSIELKFSEPTRGGFYIFDDGSQIAELEFRVEGRKLNAYHTGVRKELEGQGIASRLFDALVKYARDNRYQIIPSCPYILAKFRRNPAGFSDIWIPDDNKPAAANRIIGPAE